MTNNEIDKLLNILDVKTLEQVKQYLLKEKEKNIMKLRQRTFENYMCNKGKKFAFDDGRGNYICEKDSNIIFTNGISFYYINKNLINTNSPKIIKNSTNNLVQYQHRIEELSNELLAGYEHKFEIFTSKLEKAKIDDTYINKNLIKFLAYDEYHYLRDDIDDYVEKIFSKKEIEIANILLDNPKYEMDLYNPLLYGESNNGKVYILGFKN